MLISLSVSVWTILTIDHFLTTLGNFNMTILETFDTILIVENLNS